MAVTAHGGTRYSIHDHLFDFSQPEVACTECHDQGDERLGRKPTHQWNIGPVKFPKAMTMEEACRRCHADKEPSWIEEKYKVVKKRL